MNDNVVTKDCIVVAHHTDIPVAMARKNLSNLIGSVVDNTGRDGQQQSKTSTPSKAIKNRSSLSFLTPQKQAADKAVAATGSAPRTEGSRPSSSAVAAAKQVGLTASTGTAAIVAKSSVLQTSDRHPRKRPYDQASPPSEQKQKPEYARRGAPPEYINQSDCEIMSIHSSDTDTSDSDKPLVEGQKKRFWEAQRGQIQSLTQQLSDSRATCSKVTQEKNDTTELAIYLKELVDDMRKQLDDKDRRYEALEATVADPQQNEEAYQQAAATRITSLERENRFLSEMNSNVEIRYGQLQGRKKELQDKYNQTVFDHNSLKGRFEELQGKNNQLQGEIARLKHRDEAWQRLWDARIDMEDKWRSDLMEIAEEMYVSRGRGGTHP
ncbi:hypothetical protein DHEL01_v209105 [Diaporthe helianthi]|uniref:Uncharacterized protein n=1 Tax=Diaporthe helianthi TaxID=158607 RepID=A0A2P5HQH6_DIAHE|nr:hypothetical protein DHEL01_v209105 [Diaporthe helianthi]